MAMTAAELIKADQDHLIHPLHHPIDNAEPVIYVRGRGATIEDIGGHQMIDGLSGLWNVNVGHGRVELADAAAAQMKEMAYFSGYVGSSSIPAITLASKLVELAPDMHGIFFSTGGAEANESAFKTARFYWKARGKPDKVKVIARQQAYHGVTQQAMSATGMAAYWKMFEPRMPGFVHIPTCYPYRVQEGKPGETAGQTAARLLEEAIVREGPGTVAAFIAEPVGGSSTGHSVPEPGYFRRVREICDRHEVLFIADEVITGFCRTGKWFATSHWNVKPDIRSFAKGVTSGYLPLGGIMVSRAIKEAIDGVKPEDRWMHAYTYSGHPTCCAVGIKNIEIMERERLYDNAAKMGDRLYAGLKDAFKDHPHAGDIRGGKGLLAAVELVEDRATKKNFPADKKVAPRLQAEMMKRDVVTRVRPTSGAHPANGDTVFFSPPLVVNEKQVDQLVSVSRDAVKAVLGV
jgi:adenosylmethionine-8-amino-7-oxononanoate aminotransferase